MKNFKQNKILLILFIFLLIAAHIDVKISKNSNFNTPVYFSLGFYGCSEKNNGGTGLEEPVLVIAPQELYFGQIPEGHGAMRQYKLSNIGNVTLNISSFTVEGNNAAQFSLSGNPTTLMLEPLNSVVFGIEFLPDVIGDFSAQIKLMSNNSTSPDHLPLTGKGTIISGSIVTFERILGGLDSDGNSSVAITFDGGYVLAGTGIDTITDEGVAELTRLNMFGDILWRKQYPTGETSAFEDLIIDNNDDIIAVGVTPTAGNSDALIVKTDANGNLIWQKIWGGFEKDEAHAIILTADNAYLIAGESNNTEASGGIKDALLIKMDNTGNVIWNKLYGTAEGEYALSVAQSEDGGYVFTGLKTRSSTVFDFYLVKTDADGNQVWEKTYTRGIESHSVAAAADGGYILAGYTINEGIGGEDIYIIKTNSNGDTLWTRTYGGINGEAASEVIQTEDLGYVIVGSSASYGQGANDVYMIKLDNSGNEVWVRLYGGPGGDGASSVKEKPGDGLIVSGTTNSYGGGSNIYVLKMKADGTF